MSDSLRLTPSQERARARLASLVSAAQRVIDRDGRDSFTTNSIAQEAGCSIGTFYRYFPDRVAVLDYLMPNRDAAAEALMDVREILSSSECTEADTLALARIQEWSAVAKS